MGFGWKMAVDTKFLGTGMGASHAYWKKMTAPDQFSGLKPEEYGAETVMSAWAQIVAELGAPGVLLYLAFGISLIGGILRSLLRTGQGLAASALVTCVVYFVFYAHWMSNVSRTDVWIWYAIWGLVPVSLLNRSPSAPEQPV